MTENRNGAPPRVRGPKIKLKPSDPIHGAIPAAMDPAKVYETFEEFLRNVPYTSSYNDDIYHAVRGVRVASPQPVSERPGRSPIHITLSDVAVKPGEILAWPVYGKVLKPKLMIVTSSAELRRALAKCVGATLLPTRTSRGAGYIEAVAHVPKRGESIVIRVPEALFAALPTKLAEQVYARDLRNRLLGQFVVHWQDGDPMMLKPIHLIDRRRVVGIGTPSIPDVVPLPQMIPPPPVASGRIGASSYLDQRQPMSWITDTNSPEYDEMKWDLTLFDVAADFGVKAAFRIMADTAKQYGWAAVLANPHTQNGFARWYNRKEREAVLTATRLYPSLKKHAKRVSDVLNLSASLFGSAKKATETVKASADRIADPR